jgi:flavin reductase (DIM6/NTAB) family NADH-FMN oxidoreductase RutF
LATLVVPRPIAFVSTLAADGVPNLAPFSFFMVGGANPPSLMISPTPNRFGQEKDTLTNIRATGEFVVNLVHRAMAEGMNRTSAPFPPEVSEWEPSGFTPVAGERVAPARVKESWAALECRLFQVVEHGSGPSSARYVIGEVLLAHVKDDFTPESWIARLGGAGYVDLADGGGRFEMPRDR